ncbi:GGDEF domain-containing protein [Telmatospirillum sp.]|uniref:GGDEF domain-containing protein n=1 Tax=Telmatospirillum sp. TaxID=2079197 RepID=UPI0028482E68|nr:GGDEF domain-containing protein [Telmatospirillum sp.]MDR3438320.1 GGDEF domain-containing protein [Telmatospirillum sp.]
MVFIYVGIRIGQALTLVYLWSTQRNYPPAKDWAIGALMSAGGLFLLALRNLVPAWFSDVLSNALLLPGWMIFDYGIVRAAGKRPSVKLGLALCATAVGSLAWHEFVWPSYPAQVVTQNSVFVIFDLYAAYACLTVSGTRIAVTFRLIATLLILLVMICIWRVAGGVFGMTLTLPPTLPRILLVAASVIISPMIVMLLALQTSQRLQEEINDQARHDALTGAFNRRAFDDFVNREWSRAARHGAPLSVLSLDIDRFKKFNDRHGHQTGDAALVQVSNAARTALRSSDIWCRYGGEEFVAVLPDTTIEQAVEVAERLRASVEKTKIVTPSGLLNVSVSIGVAERSSAQSHWTEVLVASDAALYRAKAAGRNRVVAAENTAPDGPG